MATLEEMQRARANAEKAGDLEAVRVLSNGIARAQAEQQSQGMPPAMAAMFPPQQVAGSVPNAPEPTLAEAAIGAGEAALALGTGAAAGAVGMLGGTLKGIAQSVLEGSYGTEAGANRAEQTALQTTQAAAEMAYQPRTEAGQQMTQAAGEIATSIAPAIVPLIPAFSSQIGPAGAVGMSARMAAIPAEAATRAVAGRAGQVASAVAANVREAAGIAPAASRAARATAGAPSGQPSGGFGQTAQSMGAAEAQMAEQRAQTAAGLPVPVTLTRGARDRDAAQLAFEREQIKNPELGVPLRQRAELNNMQLLQNFDAIADQTGAALTEVSPIGRSVTRALLSGYENAKNRTRAAYARAFSSPGAQEVVDLSRPVQFMENGQQMQTTVFDFINSRPAGLPSTAVPDAARRYALSLGIADIDESGNLVPRQGTTVAQMENWRREVSGSASAEPTDRRYERVIKQMIDDTVGDAGGDDFRLARAARRDQARKYENRAVVARLVETVRGRDDPRVASDDVFKNSIRNSSPEEITFLRRVLLTSGPDGRQAWNELQGAAIREIKNDAIAAGQTDSQGNPVLSFAKINQKVQALDRTGQLDAIFGPQRSQLIRDLNEVASYVGTNPPGTLINNSGTAMTLMAALAEAGATGALTGVAVPVASILKAVGKGIKNNRLKARIADALNPQD